MDIYVDIYYVISCMFVEAFLEKIGTNDEKTKWRKPGIKVIWYTKIETCDK